jgi:hypothetical protein
MIVARAYKLPLTGSSVAATLVRRDNRKDAELVVLGHENAVPRHQITGSVRYERADRHRARTLRRSQFIGGWCRAVRSFGPGTVGIRG